MLLLEDRAWSDSFRVNLATGTCLSSDGVITVKPCGTAALMPGNRQLALWRDTLNGFAKLALEVHLILAVVAGACAGSRASARTELSSVWPSGDRYMMPWWRVFGLGHVLLV